MAKTNPLGVRVSVETKAALDRAADEDMRSTSSLVEKILVEWLRSRGHLPASAAVETGKEKRGHRS